MGTGKMGNFLAQSVLYPVCQFLRKSMSSNSQWQPGTQRSGVTGVDGYKVEHA